MNQILKSRVYTKGNARWIDYIEVLTDMNTLERQVFEMWHKDCTDETIKAELMLSQKTLDKIETSISQKLTWAILYCIDFTMRND